MSPALTREDALRLQECVAAGGVAVFPSDTVYGVCCDPENHDAARRMYQLKGRPAARSCAVMFFELSCALAQLEDLTDAERLALEVLLPGPFTLLLANRSQRFAAACRNDPWTLGLRVPRLPEAIVALALAGENARRLGLEVRWLQADLLEGIGDRYEAVVANLPYVAEPERASLAPEILRHEPHDALFAGADGLHAIRRLAAQLAVRPRVRFAALEVGARQAPLVARLLRESGFEEVRSERDLAGIERVVVGERVAA